MIELTDINGNLFILNCNLIETVEGIPETKITLTNGKYMLVLNTAEDVIDKVITYNRKIFGPDKEIHVVNEVAEF